MILRDGFKGSGKVMNDSNLVEDGSMVKWREGSSSQFDILVLAIEKPVTGKTNPSASN